MKLFGSLTSVTFSPIVTIEPRRRKFHCPIRLKIPLPSGYRKELFENLHLLCSITGGQNRAVWEDVTGSTPLSILDDCLVFTTTVSARFWLVHCRQRQHCPESTRYAAEIYRHLIAVPFMAKFVIFAKRRDINEANIRVFCMTDDKEERTLEVQEHYSQVARSRDVEVLEGQTLYLEFGGNLAPTHLSGSRFVTNSSALINEQLAFAFHAFQENRLAFAVRLKELGQEPSGRIAFMEDSIRYLASLNAQQRAFLNERRRRAVCTLGVTLPTMCVNYDNILGTPKRNSYYASARIGDLSLADVAAELEQPSLSAGSVRDGGDSLQSDWLELAPRLGIPRDEVDFITDYCTANQIEQARAGVSPALIMLMHWFKLASPDTRDQDLARALVAIGRDDIAKKLNFPIEPKRISRSTMELLREIELIPVRSTENLYAASELSDYRYRSPSRGASLRRLDPPRDLAATAGLTDQTSGAGGYALRSDSRSSIGIGRAERAGSASSGGGSKLINQSSRTEISVPSAENVETRVSTREETKVPSIQIGSAASSGDLTAAAAATTSSSGVAVAVEQPLMEQRTVDHDDDDEQVPATMTATTTTATPLATAASGDTLERPLTQPSASATTDPDELEFIERLVEKIFAEAVEAYQQRQSTIAAAAADNSSSSAAAAAFVSAPSVAEWTEDNNGTLSHRVEQTTLVESKPRASSSKKQRRRKDLGAGGGWQNNKVSQSPDDEGEQRHQQQQQQQGVAAAAAVAEEAKEEEAAEAEPKGGPAPVEGAQAREEQHATNDGAPTLAPKVQNDAQARSPSLLVDVRRSSLRENTTPQAASPPGGRAEEIVRERSSLPSPRPAAPCAPLASEAIEAEPETQLRVDDDAPAHLARPARTSRRVSNGCSLGNPDLDNATSAPAADAIEIRFEGHGNGQRTGAATAPAAASPQPDTDSSDFSSIATTVIVAADSCDENEPAGGHVGASPTKTTTTTTETAHENHHQGPAAQRSGSLDCARLVASASRREEGVAPASADLDSVRRAPISGSQTERWGCFRRESGHGARAKFKDEELGPLMGDEPSAVPPDVERRQRRGRRSETGSSRSNSSGSSSSQSMMKPSEELGASPTTAPTGSGGNGDDDLETATTSVLASCVAGGSSQRSDIELEAASGPPKKQQATPLRTTAERQHSDADDQASSRDGASSTTIRGALKLLSPLVLLPLEASRSKPSVDLTVEGSIKISTADTRRPHSRSKQQEEHDEGNYSSVGAGDANSRSRIASGRQSTQFGLHKVRREQQIITSTSTTSGEDSSSAVTRKENLTEENLASADSNGERHQPQRQLGEEKASEWLYSTSGVSHELPSRTAARTSEAATRESEEEAVEAEDLEKAEEEKACEETSLLEPQQKQRDILHHQRRPKQQHIRPKSDQFSSDTLAAVAVTHVSISRHHHPLQPHCSADSSSSHQSYRVTRKRRSLTEAADTAHQLRHQSTPSLSAARHHQRRGSSSTSSGDRSGGGVHHQSLSSSHSIYATAPLADLPSGAARSSSNLDATLATSPSFSVYETATSNLTDADTITTTNNDDDDEEEEDSVAELELARSASTLANDDDDDDNNEHGQDMVSGMMALENRPQSLARSSNAGSATITPSSDVGRLDEETQMNAEDDDQAEVHQQQQQQRQQHEPLDENITMMQCDDEPPEIDEDQMRRILTCKRLSEGCNRLNSSFITRKNSLHMMDTGLPPVTEGEPMKHHMSSYHMGGSSQNMGESHSASGSSGSLRRPSCGLVGVGAFARRAGSQDENTTSCSSSTSLERSPTSRRRSSTVSQCSSVLSEGARNQLNFDLSPDLAPDSSLLEANAISPSQDDLEERPASPEPSSMSGDAFDDLHRPVSRLSPGRDLELLMRLPSPDSTLGDSNDNEILEDHLGRLTQSCSQEKTKAGAAAAATEASGISTSESPNLMALERLESESPLERLINDVSTVVVSGDGARILDAVGRAELEPPSTAGTSAEMEVASLDDDDHEQDRHFSLEGSPQTATAATTTGQRASQVPRLVRKGAAQSAAVTGRDSPLPQKLASATTATRKTTTNLPKTTRIVKSSSPLPQNLACGSYSSSSEQSGRRSATAAATHLSTHSICSSSSSSSSHHSKGSGGKSRAAASNKQYTKSSKDNEESRLLHLIELERKQTTCGADSRLSRGLGTLKEMPSSDANVVVKSQESERKKVAVAGRPHQHSHQGSLCYCHRDF